jgi:hypothetical protein
LAFAERGDILEGRSQLSSNPIVYQDREKDRLSPAYLVQAVRRRLDSSSPALTENRPWPAG